MFLDLANGTGSVPGVAPRTQSSPSPRDGRSRGAHAQAMLATAGCGCAHPSATVDSPECGCGGSCADHGSRVRPALARCPGPGHHLSGSSRPVAARGGASPVTALPTSLFVTMTQSRNRVRARLCFEVVARPRLEGGPRHTPTGKWFSTLGGSFARAPSVLSPPSPAADQSLSSTWITSKGSSCRFFGLCWPAGRSIVWPSLSSIS